MPRNLRFCAVTKNENPTFQIVPALLGSLDEDFLPDVDLDHGNLNYTVVIGEVLGNYEAEVISTGFNGK